MARAARLGSCRHRRAPGAALRRQHQLQHHAHQQQGCHHPAPSPSREPIAVIHPQRAMQPTQCTQKCDGCDERTDKVDRLWRVAEQQHPEERPRGCIDSRKHASAGPVRRVRRGFSGDQQPLGLSIPMRRAGSTRPRSNHTDGLRSGSGSHRRPASRADAHATSASFFIAPTPPSVSPGPTSSRAHTGLELTVATQALAPSDFHSVRAELKGEANDWFRAFEWPALRGHYEKTPVMRSPGQA